MKTLALTIDGDLHFENGDFQIIQGVEEVQQSLTISLSTNLSEWFLNREFGLDFSVLFEKPTDEQIRSEIMRVIAQEDRVEAVDELIINQNRKQRKLEVKYTIRLIDGTTLSEEVVIGGT